MVTMFAVPAIVIVVVVIIAMPLPELGYKTVANARTICVPAGNAAGIVNSVEGCAGRARKIERYVSVGIFP